MDEMNARLKTIIEKSQKLAEENASLLTKQASLTKQKTPKTAEKSAPSIASLVSVITQLPISSNFKSKKMSRDCGRIQLYSCSEQASRTKGRNGPNSIHRKLTTSGATFDVYKGVSSNVSERREASERGSHSMRRTTGTSSVNTNNTDYNSASINNSLAIFNSNSGQCAILGEIHKRHKSVSQSIGSDLLNSEGKSQSRGAKIQMKISRQIGILNSRNSVPKKTKENSGAGLSESTIKCYKKVHVGNKEHHRKNNLSVSYVGKDNNFSNQGENRYGI